MEDLDNTTASELPVVLHPAPTMVDTLSTEGTRAAIDERTRALDIEARVICFRAADILEEQSEVLMGEREEEMEAPIIPVGEGPSSRAPTAIERSTNNVVLTPIQETPDDASLVPTPSPVLLKQQKNCIRMMLAGVTQTITTCKLNQLFNCRHVVDNIFSMNWAPLNIRPLKIAFDEVFVYLESLKEFRGQDPSTLFEQEVEERLVSLRAKLDSQRQELDAPIVAQNQTLASLDKLLDIIEKTRLVLVDLEQQYIFQQQRLEEQSSRLEACQYNCSIIEKELKEFEAMMNEWFGADWQQKDKAFLVKKYLGAKHAMMRRRMDEFNVKCQAFFEN